MRLFMAVDLDEGARSLATRAIRNIEQKIQSADTAPRVAWVAVENLHVTVRFLGRVDEQLAERLIDEFQTPLTARGFTAAIGGLGAFPERGAPRAIWIGVLDGLRGFCEVYEEVWRRIRPLGVAPEGRPYSPHLTLGRVKQASRGAVDVLRGALQEGSRGSARWHVDRVTLYESRLSPGGSQYHARATARLMTA